LRVFMVSSYVVLESSSSSSASFSSLSDSFKMKSNMSNAQSRIAFLTVRIEEGELEIENEKKKSNDKTKVPTTTAPKETKKPAGPSRPTKPITKKSVPGLGPSSRSHVPAKRITPASTTSIKKTRGQPSTGTPGATKDEHKKKLSHLKNIDRKFIDMILNEAVEDDRKVTFDDIGGMDLPKELLTEMVILPSERPELFQGLRSPARGLLLFGPPGNGKTLLAKALASEAKAVFFNISAATLTSKWIGEGEKTVRALFAVARELQPAIIFIDEIDSLLTARKENEHEASRRMKTEFLTSMDGMSAEQGERILVLGATNVPWELDTAALRRLPKRVYAPLPDHNTRKDILKKTMRKQNNLLSEKDYDKISSAAEGYSGSDLAALASDAAQQPIRELTREELRSIPADKVRGVKLEDFYSSLKNVSKSVSSDHLSKFVDWNKEFGSSGS